MNPDYELRLATRAAHLYWIEQLKQVEIAKRLNISQAGVSRLLRNAQSEGIVSISIRPPAGSYHELEHHLAEQMGLEEVVISSSPDDSEAAIVNSIGQTAAHFLEATIRQDDQVGISSWSSALASMSEHLSGKPHLNAKRVVQLMGGMANGNTEHLAESLTLRLANQLNAQPSFMHVPGIASSVSACEVMFNEPYVREAVSLFENLTVALVGIGTLEPSRFLARSGNVFSKPELSHLACSGAVGDVCLRFFDAQGSLVENVLNERVVAICPESLLNIPRVVGVAGGAQKVEAILAAASGGWIKVLITDSFTAELLVSAINEKQAKPELPTQETPILKGV